MTLCLYWNFGTSQCFLTLGSGMCSAHILTPSWKKPQGRIMSPNDSMAKVGRDLWRPALQQRCLEQAVKHMSRELLSISMEGGSMTSLNSLSTCSVMLSIKKCFLGFRWHLLYFSLCQLPIASWHWILSVAAKQWREVCPELTQAKQAGRAVKWALVAMTVQPGVLCLYLWWECCSSSSIRVEPEPPLMHTQSLCECTQESSTIMVLSMHCSPDIPVSLQQSNRH